MIETVSSRSPLTAFSAAAFLGGAALCWTLPTDLRVVPWAGALFAVLGAGFAYRWVAPVDAVLEADAQGVHWRIGPEGGEILSWAEIVALGTVGDDEALTLRTAAGRTVRVPTIFLRRVDSRARFLAAVAQARPDLPRPGP